MAKKNNDDLFDRLREAGLRKRVAKTLSEIGEGASKKALQAARTTVSDLRSLADEIERRLLSVAPGRRATGKRTGRTAARSRAATPRASRSSAATAGSSRRAQRPASGRKRPEAQPRKSTAASARSAARAPRGQNKAKILASLKSGPKTASEIANETGIGAGTVGSTLSKMATAGEVRKADRGYGLPS
jgi:hypothetical protein